MASISVAEIKHRADIQDVWTALGGGELRRGRGQAFWRGGDGYNVALDSKRGVWYDHAAGAGGDVISLVQIVRQCGFLEAAEWLAQHTGIAASKWIRRDAESDTDWATDLLWGTWWSMAAEILAEDTLAALPYWDPERPNLTAMLATIRLGDAALVEEYRRWRRRRPEWTAGLCKAGQRSDARVQRRLALWIERMA